MEYISCEHQRFMTLSTVGSLSCLRWELLRLTSCCTAVSPTTGRGKNPENKSSRLPINRRISPKEERI
ncbi:hypothetical protein F2Q69_00020190 [Brassica cretica]|uniref:Uncharacterized protein n=1 Tax=Brassica cretica TaxID=69181 RepID=A0A8S9QCP5_BRACR|nr:hypothetical protein F2Q69_00020190 [Brassica cretica]